MLPVLVLCLVQDKPMLTLPKVQEKPMLTAKVPFDLFTAPKCLSGVSLNVSVFVHE